MKNYADRGGCDRYRARGGRKRPDFNWVFPGLIPRSAYWPGIIPGHACEWQSDLLPVN